MEHKVAAKEEWLEARQALLAKEKEFTQMRDELSQLRRDLPWEKVEKNYAFDGPKGKESLADLFDGKSQLIVYHFMFDPDWNEGCKSCSFLADHYDPSIIHLKHRDVTMVTVSRAPLEKLEAYKDRMGWQFKWLSSAHTDFNFDYNVSFKPEDRGQVYNYKDIPAGAGERPGISVFYKDEQGNIFHTYSSFARGLDMFLTAYHLLDIVPKGRDEAGLKHGMDWVRRHDSYEDRSR